MELLGIIQHFCGFLRHSPPSERRCLHDDINDRGTSTLTALCLAYLFTSAVSSLRIKLRNSAEYFFASFAGKVNRPAMRDRISIFPSTDSKGVE